MNQEHLLNMELLGPYLPQDPLMVQAWVDCLLWSVTNPDIVAAFRQQTDCHWTPATTGLERMIDQATGAEADFVRAYVAWFAQAVWGPEDGDEDG